MNLVRILLNDRRGSVIPIAGGAIAVLLGVSALSVDSGQLYLEKTRMQNAADAAALAAAQALPDETAARAAAISFAGKNMPAHQFGNVLQAGDVIFGNWNSGTRAFTPNNNPRNSVQVTIRRTAASNNAVPTFLAQIFGVDSVDMSVTSLAGNGVPWDVELVQDVTSSFSVEIADARAADLALLNCLQARASPESKIGLVSFTGVSQTRVAIGRLGDLYAAMETSINQIRTCGNTGMPPCSGTNIAAGLNTGIDQLLSAPPADPAIKRAIVLVSDGQPNYSYVPGVTQPGQSTTLWRTWAVQAADRAAANNYSVFTIFYDRDNDNAAATFLASLRRGNGISLRTPSASELPALLGQVCSIGMKVALLR